MPSFADGEAEDFTSIPATRPYGISNTRSEEESVELNSHLAHHEFRHNSLRIVGVNLTDEQMEDVVVDQLEELDQGS